MNLGPKLSLVLVITAAVLAGCASRDRAAPPSRYYAPVPAAGETDLDRQWQRYEGVQYEAPPPPGRRVPRFTFGFGSGTPQRLYFD
jgi:hypothetical protein